MSGKYRPEYARKYYLKHKDRIDAYSKRRYEQNRAACIEQNKNRRARIKREVFEHYGGIVCACCGETNIKFLTLDHKNNDGNRFRKAQPREAMGWNLYYWIRRNNYPPIFQVLCYNCNCGRAKNGGVCPHKEP
jgi:hypothetical protein